MNNGIDFLSIGLRIKQLRKEKNITQEQLAEAVDSDRAFIAHIETGSRGISLEYLVRMANYFDVSADYILSDSLNSAEDESQYFFIDCTPDEKAFLLQCVASIKGILTEYKLKK